MTWQRTVLWLLLTAGILFSGIGAGACAGRFVTPNASLPEQAISPGLILEKPASFESVTVTVKGVFHGWRGPCRNGPPVSRSDWMIADSSGCLYIHGPVPPGPDPAKPSGENISISGVVRLRKGQSYLEVAENK